MPTSFTGRSTSICTTKVMIIPNRLAGNLAFHFLGHRIINSTTNKPYPKVARSMGNPCEV